MYPSLGVESHGVGGSTADPVPVSCLLAVGFGADRGPPGGENLAGVHADRNFVCPNQVHSILANIAAFPGKFDRFFARRAARKLSHGDVLADLFPCGVRVAAQWLGARTRAQDHERGDCGYVVDPHAPEYAYRGSCELTPARQGVDPARQPGREAGAGSEVAGAPGQAALAAPGESRRLRDEGARATPRTVDDEVQDTQPVRR